MTATDQCKHAGALKVKFNRGVPSEEHSSNIQYYNITIIPYTNKVIYPNRTTNHHQFTATTNTVIIPTLRQQEPR
jgi:hypothetical protein